MAQFNIPTNFRPAIGVAEIPIYFQGKVVAYGDLLRDGTFSYLLTDSDLIVFIHRGHGRVVLAETRGHYFAEIIKSDENLAAGNG